MAWKCPRCRRSFTRENQRHACGTGDRSEVLRNRPAALVERKVDDAMFFKVVSDGKKVTVVTKLHTKKELKALQPYLKEAYLASLG